MKHKVFVTGMVVSFVSVVSLVAHAATIRVRRYHGSGCHAAASSLSSNINYNQFGAHNTGSVAVTVICPLPTENATSASEVVTLAAVNVYDRHPSQDIACNLFAVDGLGNPVFNGPQSSTGGGPGAGAQSLSFSVPSVSVQNTWFIQCTLPPAFSGNFSHLTLTTLTSMF